MDDFIPTIEVERGTLINATAQEALAAGATQREIDAALEAVAMAAIRAKRTAALADSDWAVMPDSPLDAKARSQYVAYRAALRDLPSAVTKGDITADQVMADESSWPQVPTIKFVEKDVN
jgi:Phage tail assembly chaperone protein